MCQECSVLQSAHRYKIQMFLHLTARKNRRVPLSQAGASQSGASEASPRELEAALSEAASGINEAWERLVEHQAFHLREQQTLGNSRVSAHLAQI